MGKNLMSDWLRELQVLGSGVMPQPAALAASTMLYWVGSISVGSTRPIRESVTGVSTSATFPTVLRTPS